MAAKVLEFHRDDAQVKTHSYRLLGGKIFKSLTLPNSGYALVLRQYRALFEMCLSDEMQNVKRESNFRFSETVQLII